MKVLYGYLNIKNTKLKDLRILEGLENLECDKRTNLEIEHNSEMTTIGMTRFSSTNCNISITYNKNLEKLELPNLKNFYITNANNLILPVIGTGRLSSSFCVTLEEMTNFLTSGFLKFGSSRGPYCNFSIPTLEKNLGEKFCEIQNVTLSDFDESCKRIIGHIMIRSGDEPYVNKLKNVTWVFGNVDIYGTDLTSIDFFDSLEYVARDNNDFFVRDYGITVLNNRMMKHAVFPNLKKVPDTLYFSGNHENFMVDPSICLETTNGLNITEFRSTQIDGRSCGDENY